MVESPDSYGFQRINNGLFLTQKNIKTIIA